MLLNVLCLLNVAVSAWASKPNIVLIRECPSVISADI